MNKKRRCTFVGAKMSKKGKVYRESSPLTEEWIEELERKLKKKIDCDLKIEPRGKRYWGYLIKQGPDKTTIVKINPRANNIRIHFDLNILKKYEL